MTAPERPALHDLLRACHDGHAEARGRLAERLYPQVSSLVHRELASDYRRHHAWLMPLFSTGDIVQDALMSALSGLATDDAPEDEDSLVRYLTTVVRHRIVDQVRFHSAERRDARIDRAIEAGADAAAQEHGPATRADLSDRVAAIHRVLETFPERTRMLLHMRMLDNREFAEIAERLGWPSRSACNKAFLHARATLLVRLRSLDDDPPAGESR